MTTIYMKKIGKALVPDSEEEAEKLQRFRGVIKCEITTPRNVLLHRKWWKLVSVAYDFASANMAPVEHRGVPVKACIERFRKDLLVWAGYFDMVYSVVDDKIYKEAKSISFASMTEDEFAVLYSATIDTILEKVIPNVSEEEFNEAIERTLAYA